MIILSTTSDILRVTTTTANALTAQANFTDSGVGYFSPDRQNTAIASVATTTILSAVGASLKRALKSLVVKASGGPNGVVIDYFDGSTAFQLQALALALGESIEYEDAAGWFVRAADGSIKGATGPVPLANQTHIGWAPILAGQTSNLLTLIPAGHTPGLYLASISQIVVTTSTASFGQETVNWSNGGARTISSLANAFGTPTWTVAGLAVNNSAGSAIRAQLLRAIYSDGISAITAQVTAGGVLVLPVIDVYASACRIGT